MNFHFKFKLDKDKNKLGGKGEINKPRIYVVEDELYFVDSLEGWIEELGYTFIGSSSTSDRALDEISIVRPDLILMDIKIGGKYDGIDAASLIKEKLDVPIIFITAFNDPETVERAKFVEPAGFLVKPITSVKGLRGPCEIALYNHKQQKQSSEKRKESLSFFNSNNSEEFLEFCSILASEERLRIVEYIGKKPHTFNEIKIEINKSKATTSHHISQLEEKGIIINEKVEKKSYYSLKNPYNLVGMIQIFNLSRILSVLQAISSPERFRILKLLIRSDKTKKDKLHNSENQPDTGKNKIKPISKSASEIKEEFNKDNEESKSASTISHHLKVLEQAELIKSKKDGRKIYYSAILANFKILDNFYKEFTSLN